MKRRLSWKWAIYQTSEAEGTNEPVLEAHDVVEDRVDGGAEVVEESRDVEEVFINGPVNLCVLEVDVAQPLGVERRPTDEERQHNSSWGSRMKMF